jgi:uncharacterized protein (TIGR02284 family)
MNRERSIEVLNNLIEINNDRIEGYETALKQTEAPDLKTLFYLLIQTSQKCRTELVNEVLKLGGKPMEGTKISGKFYRFWMEIKAAITCKDRKSILNSCEFGEDVAIDTYKEVLRDNVDDISMGQKELVMAQHAMIKGDHDIVKSLRDRLLEHN